MNELFSYSAIVPATISTGNPRLIQPNCTASIANSGNCTPAHLALFSQSTHETKQVGRVGLNMRPHPQRAQRYLLQVCQGDRAWAYPIAWTHVELMALKMMARETILGLDLSLADAGPPKDVGKLHQLIERLYPSVARVAAMAGGAVNA